MNTQAAAIPWYKSPQTLGLITTFVAAAVALFPKAAATLGLISPDAISAVVTDIAGVIALLSPLIGTVVRAKSTIQPITLTQAGADVHPATIAAHIAQTAPAGSSPSTVLNQQAAAQTSATRQPTAPTPSKSP